MWLDDRHLKKKTISMQFIAIFHQYFFRSSWSRVQALFCRWVKLKTFVGFYLTYSTFQNPVCLYRFESLCGLSRALRSPEETFWTTSSISDFTAACFQIHNFSFVVEFFLITWTILLRVLHSFLLPVQRRNHHAVAHHHKNYLCAGSQAYCGKGEVNASLSMLQLSIHCSDRFDFLISCQRAKYFIHNTFCWRNTWGMINLFYAESTMSLQQTKERVSKRKCSLKSLSYSFTVWFCSAWRYQQILCENVSTF